MEKGPWLRFSWLENDAIIPCKVVLTLGKNTHKIGITGHKFSRMAVEYFGFAIRRSECRLLM